MNQAVQSWRLDHSGRAGKFDRAAREAGLVTTRQPGTVIGDQDEMGGRRTTSRKPYPL